MQATIQTLRNYRKKELMGLSLESLSSLYKQTFDDAIIAEVFFKLKDMIHKNIIKYSYIDACDTISFALEKIQSCLLKYSDKHKVKFSTYFYTVYNNRITDWAKTLNNKKQCISFKSTSLEYLMENNFEYVDTRTEELQMNYTSLGQIIDIPDNLTENEKQFCYLLAIDYGSNKEIAEYMGVSVMLLSYMRNRLKTKLKHLL